jgi:hypothetical protein
MTSIAKHGETHRRSPALDDASWRAVEQFAQLVTERVEALAPGPDRTRFVKLAKQAVREARASLNDALPARTGSTFTYRYPAPRAEVASRRLAG